MSTKRTYQPSKIRRVKKLSFRARMATKGGRRVLSKRRSKGRHNLTTAHELGTGAAKNKKRRYS